MRRPPIPNLTDCTEALSLVYDRGPDGYGVPVPGSRFPGTQLLLHALLATQQDLRQIGWWDYIKSVLTAGLWVDKKGAHGKGIAWDFDGVVLKQNPLVEGRLFQVAMMYKEALDIGTKNSLCYIPLSDRIKTRLACLLSLRFGVVLTAGYQSKDGKYHHEDHIHADLSRTVKWRSGSRSQVVLVQETINAFYNIGLKVDGIMGENTNSAWGGVITRMKLNPDWGKPMEDNWLDFLKIIAFNPPKDGAK